VPKTTICSQTLSSNDVEAFNYAITRHYWYELFMDDLPIWGFVGDLKPAKAAGEDDSVVLYTHKQLDISYNGDRVRAAVAQQQGVLPVGARLGGVQLAVCCRA
jgi:transmembrane 9 superfamily protein 3